MPAEPAPAATGRPGALLRRAWHNGPLLLALCMLCWAASIVIGRAAAPLIPPSLFTLLRWSGALLIVLPLAWPHLRRDAGELRRRWWVVVLLGLIGIGAYNNLVYLGLHSTTAVNALLLQSGTPLVILVVSFLLFRERPIPRQVAAILISIAGVVVIAAQGSVEALRQLRFNAGDGLVLLAVTIYALYAAVLRLRPNVHFLSLLAGCFTVGVLGLIPLAALEFAGGARLVPTPFTFLALAYSAVFPAFLAYMFFNRGVQLLGSARAGHYVHLMPAFGVVLAMLFLGEQLHLYHLAGMLLIAAGLLLAR